MDLTASLRDWPLHTTRRIKVPQTCFATVGTDFSRVDTPFLIKTARPFAATLADIRWDLGAATDVDALRSDHLEGGR